jgi:hypothetical protein
MRIAHESCFEPVDFALRHPDHAPQFLLRQALPAPQQDNPFTKGQWFHRVSSSRLNYYSNAEKFAIES